MGEDQEQKLQAPCLLPRSYDGQAKHEDHQWVVIMDGGDDHHTCNTSSLDNSSTTTTNTGSSISSSDMVDDASSSPPSSSSSSSSSSNSSSPLYELSELITHLPIKRGLSKYYQGKSQSFTTLSRVTSIEDLAKKENPFRKRMMKASKSYGNGLDAHKSYTLPKAIITKKASRSCVSSLSFSGRRGSFPDTSRPPAVPLQKKF